MKYTHTICGMCNNNCCGLVIRHDNGRILEVKGDPSHPFSHGRVCPIGRAVPELQDAQNRLTHPLRRTGNNWRKVDWETALDEIVDRLATLRSQYGAQCIAVYQGHALLPLIHQGWIDRFLNLLGTPNLVRNDNLCAKPYMLMEKVTYGTNTLFGFDSEQVEAILLWGINPTTSASTTLWHRVIQAKKHGATLVVIDPRQTAAAERADLHITPMPGTDGALALGMINYLISNQCYDMQFVQDWTVGFDDLTQLVAEYTPERVHGITGVPNADFNQLMEILTAKTPVHISAGNALEHHSNASQTLRAVCILRALLGSLDIPGGHQFGDDLLLADMSLSHLRNAGLPVLGADRYPLFVDSERFVPCNVFMETLLSGRPYPIRAALMGGGNPLLTWPNSNLLEQAVGQLEFMVVMDTRMTETCRHADLVLPMTSFLERYCLIAKTDVAGEGQPNRYLGLQRKVLDPGLNRSDWWFWAELARRLGHAEYYPWIDERAAIDDQLKPLGISFQELDDAPHGLMWGESHTFRSFEHKGFNTPTGKVELRSTILAAYGNEPLPIWLPPQEQPEKPPGYDLVLNAGRRSLFYAHSQFRELSSLNSRDPSAKAEIHPDTAARCNLVDGQKATVESRRGKIDVHVRITKKIIPGVVSLLHGWPDANANLLTNHLDNDSVLACVPLRSGICRLKRSVSPSSKLISQQL